MKDMCVPLVINERTNGKIREWREYFSNLSSYLPQVCNGTWSAGKCRTYIISHQKKKLTHLFFACFLNRKNRTPPAIFGQQQTTFPRHGPHPSTCSLTQRSHCPHQQHPKTSHTCMIRRIRCRQWVETTCCCPSAGLGTRARLKGVRTCLYSPA